MHLDCEKTQWKRGLNTDTQRTQSSAEEIFTHDFSAQPAMPAFHSSDKHSPDNAPAEPGERLIESGEWLSEESVVVSPPCVVESIWL